MKLNAPTEPESVCAAIFRNHPGLSEIAHELSSATIERIHTQQRAVMWGRRVNKCEGLLSVAVVRRGLAWDDNHKFPAGSGCALGSDPRRKNPNARKNDYGGSRIC